MPEFEQLGVGAGHALGQVGAVHIRVLGEQADVELVGEAELQAPDQQPGVAIAERNGAADAFVGPGRGAGRPPGGIIRLPGRAAEPVLPGGVVGEMGIQPGVSQPRERRQACPVRETDQSGQAGAEDRDIAVGMVQAGRILERERLGANLFPSELQAQEAIEAPLGGQEGEGTFGLPDPQPGNAAAKTVVQRARWRGRARARPRCGRARWFRPTWRG